MKFCGFRAGAPGARRAPRRDFRAIEGHEVALAVLRTLDRAHRTRRELRRDGSKSASIEFIAVATVFAIPWRIRKESASTPIAAADVRFWYSAEWLSSPLSRPHHPPHNPRQASADGQSSCRLSEAGA